MAHGYGTSLMDLAYSKGRPQEDRPLLPALLAEHLRRISRAAVMTYGGIQSGVGPWEHF